MKRIKQDLTEKYQMMKLLYMITMAFMFTEMVQAQPSVFPLITDYPSFSGSSGSASVYIKLRDSENSLQGEVKKFNTQYHKRSLYLKSPLTEKLTTEINGEMAEILERYQRLEKRNNELNIYHYSQRKKNKKLLSTLQWMLTNLDQELNKQWSSNVLLGEKMNLYQNAMASIHKIHRKMDLIDDNIERSLIINRILGRY